MEQTAILDLLNKIDDVLIKNVQREMKKRGWNQSELGRMIGRDPNKVSRFLTKGAWDSDMLLSTANALGVPPWELLADPDTAPSIERALQVINEFVQKNLAKP